MNNVNNETTFLQRAENQPKKSVLYNYITFGTTKFKKKREKILGKFTIYFKSMISSFFAVNPQMTPLFIVLPENKCLSVSIKCTMSHKRSRPLASFQSRVFGIQTSYLGICSAKNSMVIEFITIWYIGKSINLQGFFPNFGNHYFPMYVCTM